MGKKGFLHKRSMNIIILFLYIIHTAAAECITSSESINCSCSIDSVICIGNQSDFEIQEILLNISLIHSSTHLQSVILNIEGLLFEPEFQFPDIGIRNLSLGYGLRYISDNLLSQLGSSLVSLNLQNNIFEEIDNLSFSFLFNLKELKLDFNRLSEINPGSFSSLSHLELLSISGNNINTFSTDFLQNLLEIQILIVNDNNISSVSEFKIKAPSLAKLLARRCSISGILERNSLSGLSGLQHIDFGENSIQGINEYALSSLLDLKVLDLSNNAIEYLEENAFSGLTNLTYLDLSENKISLIRGPPFANLVNLKTLNLQGNRMKAVLCEYTSDLVSLEKISLQNNHVKTITVGTFTYSPNLTELRLEGNFLDCTCDLSSFYSYLMNNTILNRDDVNAICASPPHFQATSVAKVDFHSMNCESPPDPCISIVSETLDEEDIDYIDYDDSTNTAQVSTLYLNVTDELTTVTFKETIVTSDDVFNVTTINSAKSTENQTYIIIAAVTVEPSSKLTDVSEQTVSSYGKSTDGITKASIRTTLNETKEADHYSHAGSITTSLKAITQTTVTASSVTVASSSSEFANVSEHDVSSYVTSKTADSSSTLSTDSTFQSTSLPSKTPIVSTDDDESYDYKSSTDSIATSERAVKQTSVTIPSVTVTPTSSLATIMSRHEISSDVTLKTADVSTTLSTNATSLPSKTPIINLDDDEHYNYESSTDSITTSERAVKQTSVTTPSVTVTPTSSLATIMPRHEITSDITSKIADGSSTLSTNVTLESTSLPSKSPIIDPYDDKDYNYESSADSITTSEIAVQQTSSTISTNEIFESTSIPSKKPVVKKDDDEDYDYDYDVYPTIASEGNLSTTSVFRTTATSPKLKSEYQLIVRIYDYSFSNTTFCVNWTVRGVLPSGLSCSLRYEVPDGNKTKHITCPLSGKEDQKCLTVEGIDQFCLIVYVDGKAKNKSCAGAKTARATTEISGYSYISSTLLSTEKTTPIPETTVSHSSDSTLYYTSLRNMTTLSNMPVSSTYHQVPTKNTRTTFSSGSIRTTFSSGRSSIFRVTTFDAYYDYSSSVVVEWKVNKMEPMSVCYLALTLASEHLNHTEGVFNCTNNFYKIGNVKEHDPGHLCITSYHKIEGMAAVCRHFPVLTDSTVKAAKSGSYSYQNTSLIALLCLLALVLIIIIVIIWKNYLKRRVEWDRYDVSAEEKKVQKRVSAPSLRESSARYSYITKEQVELL